MAKGKPSKKKENEIIKIEKDVDYLEVVYTPEQKKKAGVRLDQAHKDKWELEEKFKKSKENFQQKIKNANETIRINQRIVENDSSREWVNTEARFNFSTGIVNYFRMDTREQYDSRPIDDDERQDMLFDEESGEDNQASAA